MQRGDYLELIMIHAINQGLASEDFIQKIYKMNLNELEIMLDNLEAEADDYGCHPHFE
jgi:hypothetical protein